jgi:hypothetical protein
MQQVFRKGLKNFIPPGHSIYRLAENNNHRKRTKARRINCHRSDKKYFVAAAANGNGSLLFSTSIPVG